MYSVSPTTAAAAVKIPTHARLYVLVRACGPLYAYFVPLRGKFAVGARHPRGTDTVHPAAAAAEAVAAAAVS